MDEHVDVSVIISTRNRSDGLASTLASLAGQDTGGCRFEVLVVDNGSTDRTREVIESFVAPNPAGPALGRFEYIFEKQPGVSYGRNAAIRIARAPILAFTDDDVTVERVWIRNIARALNENPEVDYVTGRMRPVFESPPPAWMVQRNAGPCVLRDRGDQRIYSRPGYFFPGWATANIAFRREVFERIGVFSGAFPRGQDLELIVRLWQANGRGLYAPDVLVDHFIPVERMTKAYHRMWHTREGDIRARVRLAEVVAADGRVLKTAPPMATLLGVPGFLYRTLASACGEWLRAQVRRDESATFFHESQVRQTASYIRTRIREDAATRTHSPLTDIVRFVRALWNKRGVRGV